MRIGRTHLFRAPDRSRDRPSALTAPHGGQINVAVRPASVVLRHGYVAGMYETRGSHIYVNRGFGTAGPAARVGAPPEVSRIVLVSS